MQKTRGASLPGYLALIVVIAIAVYLLAPYILGNSKQQNLHKVRNDILAIRDAVSQYKLDNDMYPTTEQGLNALVVQPTLEPVPPYWNSKGYISNLPQDPWGQPYQYTNDDGAIRIFSFGPDGKQGGNEIDLTNLDKQ